MKVCLLGSASKMRLNSIFVPVLSLWSLGRMMRHSKANVDDTLVSV